MEAMPQDQDILIKKLHELDQLEHLGNYPEQKRINVIFFYVVLVLGGLMCVQNIFVFGLIEHTTFIVFGFVIFALLTIYGAIINSLIGKIGICILSIAAEGYSLSFDIRRYSELLTFHDAATIFIFTNSFGKKGYYISTFFVIVKSIAIFIMFPDPLRGFENVLSTIIIAMALGVVPLMLVSLSSLSRKAQKGEIKAEILSMQNQELLTSWQSYYQKSTPKVDTLNISTTPTQEDTPIVQYTSPYAEGQN